MGFLHYSALQCLANEQASASYIIVDLLQRYMSSMSRGQLTDGVSFSCKNLSRSTNGRLPFVEQLRLLDLGVCVINEVLL